MWDILVIQPLVNTLLLLYQLLFHNLTLTIVVLTVLIRAITFPLTWQQQKSAKAMQELQQSDEWKKMQEKYKDDRERASREQMALMQKAGVNPFGGCLPLLIQMPILIGLYQAITMAIAASPAQLLTLSTNIYPIMPNIAQLIPLDNKFLWMNLGLPDPYFIMPLLVVITSFLQSKVMTPASTDPQQTQTAQTMMLTSTVMFGWFSLTFASGLSVYFIIGNILGIIQYAFTNKIDWRSLFSLSMTPAVVAPEPLKKSSRSASIEKARKSK